MKIFKCALIGILAGFVTGFFSTGGGMIVLPAIIYFLNIDEKKARGSSIFIILPLVIISAIVYFKEQNFELQAGIKCAIGGIIGSILGTKILKKVSDKILKIIFMLFLLYASVSMMF